MLCPNGSAFLSNSSQVRDRSAQHTPTVASMSFDVPGNVYKKCFMRSHNKPSNSVRKGHSMKQLSICRHSNSTCNILQVFVIVRLMRCYAVNTQTHGRYNKIADDAVCGLEQRPHQGVLCLQNTVGFHAHAAMQFTISPQQRNDIL